MSPVSVRTSAVPPAGEPRQQRERRARILDATVALAAEGGFDAVQMRTVAERAEVALGTLYRYFPSKVHLLVSALARDLTTAEELSRHQPPLGDSAGERVTALLAATTARMQREPLLTEALTRAFMFADAAARDEIRSVSRLLVGMLVRAIRPDADPTSDDLAAAAVIRDVWLAALVGWVTGRTTAADVSRSLETAVRLLLDPAG
ncbi:TetR family transcriptional regulator [Nocardioides agariphilus]|jgi:AcrR family transcriptional regulator|uniref:TetR family transcriptional regulator n=1 Tax=Nocardioides agariphilus TaxID=433664 RepID=A0A930YGS7_9ACTN|nr:TetR family transcriptional regulator [Nocardioides agariphilus]MBF4767891.1 TetR family transcriptional regulator [Nocardioides agariphilus]